MDSCKEQTLIEGQLQETKEDLNMLLGMHKKNVRYLDPRINLLKDELQRLYCKLNQIKQKR